MDFNIINVSNESLSVIICLILLAFQLSEKKKTESDVWFSTIIASNMLMLICDICDCTFGGHPGRVNYYLQVVMNLILYYMGSAAMLFGIFGWIYSHIKQRENISKIWLYLCILCAAVQAVISITLPITRICYIDESNYYCRFMQNC